MIMTDPLPPEDDAKKRAAQLRNEVAKIHLIRKDIRSYLNALAQPVDNFKQPDSEAELLLFTPNPALTTDTLDEMIEIIGLDNLSDRIKPGRSEMIPDPTLPDNRKSPIFSYDVSDDKTLPINLDVYSDSITMNIMIRKNTKTGLLQVDLATLGIIPPGIDPDDAHVLEVPVAQGYQDTMDRFFEIFARAANAILANQPNIEAQIYQDAARLASDIRGARGYDGPKPPAP